jgi:hypothetical protein
MKQNFNIEDDDAQEEKYQEEKYQDLIAFAEDELEMEEQRLYQIRTSKNIAAAAENSKIDRKRNKNFKPNKKNIFKI